MHAYFNKFHRENIHTSEITEQIGRFLYSKQASTLVYNSVLHIDSYAHFLSLLQFIIITISKAYRKAPESREDRIQAIKNKNEQINPVTEKKKKKKMQGERQKKKN